MYRNWLSSSIQKYRMTFACSSDSRNNVTYRGESGFSRTGITFFHAMNENCLQYQPRGRPDSSTRARDVWPRLAARQIVHERRRFRRIHDREPKKREADVITRFTELKNISQFRFCNQFLDTIVSEVESPTHRVQTVHTPQKIILKEENTFA